MGILVRFGIAFNVCAALAYSAAGLSTALHAWGEQEAMTVVLCWVWATVSSARFTVSLKKQKKWGVDIAYNWGFFLCVALIVIIQLSGSGSPGSYAGFVLAVGQLVIVYPVKAAILFVSLLNLLFCIRLASVDAYTSIILASGVAGLGIVFRASLNRLLVEIDTQHELFMKARWAASELTDVLLHLDSRLEATRSVERERISKLLAREIHDGVGYMLTALIVQIGVACEHAGSVRTRRHLEKIERMARETLQGIREEVSSLRDRPARRDRTVSVYDRLTQLGSVFAECTGVEVKLEVQDEVRVRLTGELGESIYRIIQEALTNSYRHGSASLVDIVILKDREAGLLLRVSDNGKGAGKVVAGNGLRGIYERAEAVGGFVEYATAPGKGFDLGVDVPGGEEFP